MRDEWLGRRAVGLVLTGAGLVLTAFSGCASNSRLQMVEDRLAIEQLLMGDYPKALDSANW